MQELAMEHSGNVRKSKYSVVLNYALSEMAMGKDVTPEELRGAKIFIGILLNIAEKPAPLPPPLPDKSLGQPPKKELKK